MEGREEMAKCDFCGKTIISAGIKDNNLNYCNKKCYQKAYVLQLSSQVPKDIVDEQARKIHRGLCPKCHARGPVDVHISHRIYSALIYSSWRNIPNLCCRSCGRKIQVKDTIISLILGWWGIPLGLIMTPVQIAKNISGIIKGPNTLKPSATLENLVRVNIVSQIIASRKHT
jgi:hypothetical protein